MLSRFSSSTLLPFFFWVPLLKPNSRKKGTLIIKGLLGNLVVKEPKSLLSRIQPSTLRPPSEVEGLPGIL